MMKITLVSITVTLVLLMEVHADIQSRKKGHAVVQPQKNFDVKRFAGEWYHVGMAYDVPSFIRNKNKLMICKGVVEPKENGDATMTVWKTMSSFCQKKVYNYEKTTEPGVFKYFSTRHRRMKDITVVEVNYIEFAMIYKYKEFNKEFSQVSLYSRTLTLRPKVIEKFKKYAKKHGFPEESIIIPQTVDNCPFTRR